MELAVSESSAPRPRANDFARDHLARYAKTVAQAESAAEMTATGQWQNQYADITKRHRKAVKSLCEQIGDLADLISRADADEENEKSIKDRVKQLSEERIAYGAWLRLAVLPISGLAEQARNELNDLRRIAASREEATPLTHRGLTEEIGAIIADQKKIAWEPDTGILSVM